MTPTQKIITYLVSNRGKKAREIGSGIGMTRRETNRILYKLRAAGIANITEAFEWDLVSALSTSNDHSSSQSLPSASLCSESTFEQGSNAQAPKDSEVRSAAKKRIVVSGKSVRINKK